MNISSQARAFIVGGAVALAALLGGFFIWGQHPSIGPSQSGDANAVAVSAATEPDIPEGYVRRFSDGVPVPADEQPTHWFAVMVENSAEAWPLTGLNQARLVIEAPVEGSIPRFSAYFDDTQDDLKKIGPVRSLRPYYLDWAEGQQAMIAHVGGSPQALSLVDTRASADLNEFYWGRFFWRSLDRYAPHNVYTSIGLLKQGFAARGYTVKQPIPSFMYAGAEPAEQDRPESQEFTVPFSAQTHQYDAHWIYDRAANDYKRDQGDEPCVDADGVQVSAKNVVVMFTGVRVIDDVGRRAIDTIGEGKGRLYRDGQAFDIVWSKKSRLDPIVLKTEGGEDAALRAGNTWIEVVSLSTIVK